jgi:putative tricarboxylic transport membrane protein
MLRVNRDVLIAVLILVFCGITYWETTNIADMPFAGKGSEFWPRTVLAFIIGLSVIYLIQSVFQSHAGKGRKRKLRDLIYDYRNALWSYALFGAFALLVPYLGMLIAGFLFIFLFLTAVGNRDPRSQIVHAATAVAVVGFMWFIFTFPLGVILPQGEIIPF